MSWTKQSQIKWDGSNAVCGQWSKARLADNRIEGEVKKCATWDKTKRRTHLDLARNFQKLIGL